eukprot:g17645.t1
MEIRTWPFTMSEPDSSGPAKAKAPPANKGKEMLPTRQQPKACCVQVVVRCRPLNAREKEGNQYPVASCVGASEVNVILGKHQHNSTKTFTFDRVFGQYSTQEEVYLTSVAPLVAEVLRGFNCTVFAYGQTGTGKTHTMEGALERASLEAGVIPRAVHNIFDTLNKQSKEFSVKVSFLELYNERLTDLLGVEEDPKSKKASDHGNKDDDNHGLRICEDSKLGIVVQGLEEVVVCTANEVFDLLKSAQERRRTAETLMNKNSSRSHCVFTITIHTKESKTSGEDIIKTGNLHLVDLAGSENIGRSGATDMRAAEAGKINRSLLTLGRVITALVEKQKYIPYRDSKLTRLLQESLGGKSKTLIISTISPSADSLEETLSTLEYAHSAKKIKNRPQLNKEMTRKAYMRELLTEIAAYKREIEVLRTKNGVFLPPEQWEEMQLEMKAKSLELEEIKTALEARSALIADLERINKAKDLELVEVKELFQKTRQELEAATKELEVRAETIEKMKVEIAEKEYLIHQHQKTETALHAAATELKGKMDEAVEETGRLHEGIGRRHRHEQQNIGLVQQLQTALAQQLASLQSQLGEFCSSEVAAFVELRQGLNSFTQTKDQEIKKLCAQMQTVAQTLQASEAKLTEVMETHVTDQEEECKNSASNNAEALSSLQENLAGLSELVQANQQALHSLLQQQEHDLKSLEQKLATTFSTREKNASSFQASQASRLTALKEAMDSALEAQIQALHHQGLQVDAMRSQQAESHKQRNAQLMQQMRSLLETYCTEQQQELSAACSNINAAGVQVVSEIQQAQNRQDSAIKALLDVGAKHVQQTEVSASQDKQALKEAVAHLLGSCAKMDDEQSAAAECYAEQNNTCGATQAEHMKVFADITSRQVNLLETLAVQHSGSLQALQSAREQFVAQQTDVIHTFNQGINERLEQWQPLLQKREQQVNDYRKQHQLSTQSIQQNLTTLMGQHGPYNSTGATPARHAFAYPTSFPQTAPHDVLLLRMHQGESAGPSSLSPSPTTAPPVASFSPSTASPAGVNSPSAESPAVDGKSLSCPGVLNSSVAMDSSETTENEDVVEPVMVSPSACSGRAPPGPRPGSDKENTDAEPATTRGPSIDKKNNQQDSTSLKGKSVLGGKRGRPVAEPQQPTAKRNKRLPVAAAADKGKKIVKKIART